MKTYSDPATAEQLQLLHRLALRAVDWMEVSMPASERAPLAVRMLFSQLQHVLPADTRSKIIRHSILSLALSRQEADFLIAMIARRVETGSAAGPAS
jgi:hypothetical protein